MYRIIALVFVVLSALAPSQAHGQTCPSGYPRVAPDSRYTNSNGTVMDTKTGLVWKQCSEGQSGIACTTGTYTAQTWQQALSTAANSTFAGFNDWRLPNVKELRSLVETGCARPSINTTLFPNTPAVIFWSSTTYAPSASVALYVGFGIGNVSGNFKSAFNGVRLVRAGQ
jgi:hypothetical protein